MKFQTTHGLSRHPLYRTHREMVRRCLDPDRPAFKNYGGRGLGLHLYWIDVREFVRDVEKEIGSRPDGYSLDRIDNNQGYKPGNIKWATPSEQAKNRRYHGFHKPKGDYNEPSE